MEVLGKQCHRLALLTPVPARCTLQHLVLPYSSPCHPCHSAIFAVRVTAVPAMPPTLDGCHCACCFLKEGDANQAMDVSHLTLAREGSTCRVPVQSQQHSGKLGGGSEPGPNQQYGQH